MKLDQSTPKPVSELTTDSKLAEEIQRTLEIMGRVKTAQAIRATEVQETPGNTYLLPEPPVLRVSRSSERD